MRSPELYVPAQIRAAGPITRLAWRIGASYSTCCRIARAGL